jgi:hypothetical protein
VLGHPGSSEALEGRSPRVDPDVPAWRLHRLFYVPGCVEEELGPREDVIDFLAKFGNVIAHAGQMVSQKPGIKPDSESGTSRCLNMMLRGI